MKVKAVSVLRAVRPRSWANETPIPVQIVMNGFSFLWECGLDVSIIRFDCNRT